MFTCLIYVLYVGHFHLLDETCRGKCIQIAVLIPQYNEACPVLFPLKTSMHKNVRKCYFSLFDLHAIEQYCGRNNFSHSDSKMFDWPDLCTSSTLMQ